MLTSDLIKYCNHCGHKIVITVPEGDNRERHVCRSCGEIQYQNPKVVTGCVPYWGDRILLCKRAIEPRLGYWTVPAGFMENMETVQQGAARETLEEACAPVVNLRLFGIYNIPRISQVYIMFLAELEKEDGFGVGSESLEVDLFKESEIPWQDMAFRVVETTLRRYLEQRNTGEFTMEVIDL